MTTVKELLIESLAAHGYDGLCNDDDCGCGLDDFAPCGDCFCKCEPAHKVVITKAIHEYFTERDIGSHCDYVGNETYMSDKLIAELKEAGILVRG